MRDYLGREINVQIWPIKVARFWFLNIEHLAYRNILEPWEVLVGHKQLLLIGEKPDAVARDVCDLNRSAFSKRV